MNHSQIVKCARAVSTKRAKEQGPQESQNHATSHNGGKEGERFNDDLPQTPTNMISDIRSKTMA